MELPFDGATEVELLKAARKALERLRYMADCAADAPQVDVTDPLAGDRADGGRRAGQREAIV